jgi:hypothetical protein
MEIQGYAGIGLQPFVFPRATQAEGKDDGNMAVRTKHSEDASAAFAQNVAQRIEASMAKTDRDSQKNGSKGTTRDSSELSASMARAMEFIRSEFGDRAATTTMALVYKGLSKDEITEEQLSQGLLSAMALIDRQFGFAAGDKVIDFFNSDLNKAVNDFFDNGQNEVFFAAEPGAHAQSLSASGLAQETTTEANKEAANSILELLRQGTMAEGEESSPPVAPNHIYPPGTSVPAAYAAPFTDPAAPGSSLNITV